MAEHANQNPDPQPEATESSPATGDAAGAAGGPATGAPQPSPVTDEPAAPAEAAEAAQPDDTDAGAAAAVEHDLDELRAKARERDDYLRLAQRTQADFENYRKRMTREAALAADKGVGRLAKELLPSLDHLELALRAAEAQGGELYEGVRMVQQELVAALGRVGIQPFDPKGQEFDPNEHEAMAQQPSEGAASGTVLEVYQQGYRLNGTVLRPARVVVAQ
jgi:molecular chaperone GrpE